MFVAFVRLHGKARYPILRSWQAKLAKEVSGFEHVAGRRTGDSVWRAQVRGNLGRATNKTVVEIHEYITSCFECVLFEPLQVGAGANGYPLSLLRLSLGTYIWPRRIRLGPIAHASVFPTRGIIAGASAAVCELIATLVEPFKLMRVRHPLRPHLRLC